MAPIILLDSLMGAVTDVATIKPPAEALIAVGAALPVVAYPFLPSQSTEPGNPIEFLLIWPSILHLVLFHFINIMAWVAGQEYAHLQPWVFPLTVCSAMAGLSLATAEKHEPQHKDFEPATRVTFLIVVWELIWLVNHGLFVAGDTSLVQVMWALASTTGIFVFGLFLGEHLFEPAVMVLYRFTTRRVSWWFWLSESGAQKDFLPLWSMVLAVFVFISAPVLVVAAFQAMTSNS